ncbi:DNA primase [anaerobic digester metagenome]
MLRYNTNQLNCLNILSVAEHLGISVGRGQKTLCFIHSEKTPSLFFDLAKNRWHCFGCGAGGGVIDLVMQFNKVGFCDACEWLESVFMLKNTTPYPVKRSIQSHAKATPSEKIPLDISLYTSIIDGLSLSDKAANYLCEIRALSMNVVERNHICSIDNIADFYKKVILAYGVERLFSGGLLKTNNCNELKRSWWQPGIVFPYYSYDGGVVNLQLRPYSESRAKYMFLNGIPTAMYNERQLQKLNSGDVVYLCEGAMDALSLNTKGYNAVGIPGVNSFQDAWVDHIGRFNVIILFDNDIAGTENAEILKERLIQKNINVQIKHIPKNYKDVNEMLIAERNNDNVN